MYLRNNILYVLFSTIIFCVSASASTDNKATDTIWTEIDNAIAKQNWSTADTLISYIINSQPNDATNVMLLSNLGMIRHYSGNDSIALETLCKAHKAAPSSVTILANRATVLTAMGRISDAISDYNTIQKLDSTYSDTYLYRGLLQLYSGNFENAFVDLQKREELSPRNEDTLIALASYYTITEDNENAISYYTRLIRANPQAEYYAGRALCALRLDRLIDASEDIADGLDLDPYYSELYLCRAILNKKRYCADDARSDADRAISLGANPDRIHALLGF